MATKYGGYMGRVAMVDLSTGKVSDYPWSDEERRLYIGGKTMAAKILGDNLTKDTTALSAENMLVITTGPFTGSGTPSSSRFNISTLSPQTGIITSSNCGGNFGYYLKKAGFDALIIKGKAKAPIWLEIYNNTFRFHDAKELWGMKTGKVQEELDEVLKTSNGKPQKNGKIVIGPAGENLVRYASIVSNERLAGRGGTGSVMGFKNLKAVTVSGNHTVEVHNKKKLDKLNKSWFKYLKKHPLTGDQLPRMGTAGIVSTMQMRGQLSTKNYNYGKFDAYEKVNGERLAEEFNIVNKGCLSCPIKCARTVEVNGNPVKGPELETLGLLGGGILNSDMEAILRWNYELDELGMDSISSASTLAFAMEANEKGLWDNGLKFGEIDEISQVFEDIAHRRGIGDELANGSKWLSEKYGGKEFAIHSKGMELAAYEPRRSVGLGLGYAVSNRGGCHLNGGYMVLLEGLSLNVNQQTPHGKADFTAMLQDLMEGVSNCGQCLFTTYAFFPPPLIARPNSWYTKAFCASVPYLGPVLRLINMFPEVACIHIPVFFNQTLALHYVTGMPVTFGSFMKMGKRGYTLERHINTRFGIRRKDDTLPKRLTDEPQIKGDDTTRVPLEKMKNVYYGARGWTQDGVPTPKTLKRLGLDKLDSYKVTCEEFKNRKRGEE
ncbi:MAG: aldehyde ferredoxin oxidoreductase family protein [Firmicutes bacterium]|nr:aldehyde ferredoxin oxidoreductase family protein [Bacillota bacterium]